MFYSALEVDGQDPSAVPNDISRQIEAIFSSQNDAENTPYRKETFRCDPGHETLAAQDVEGGFDAAKGLFPSLFSDCHSSQTPLCDDAPHGTTQADDARESGARRAPISKHVAANDDHNVLQAVTHARRIGRRLNTGLTLSLPAIRDAAPEARRDLWKAERNAMGVWFNDHDDRPTYVWNRAAIDRDGQGEHCHIFLHIPPRLRGAFEDFAGRRWGEAAKLHRASDKWWTRKDQKAQSWQNYVMQGVHPLRAMNQNRAYKSGGWIVGKRTGWTTDISPKAIAAWDVRHGIVTR